MSLKEKLKRNLQFRECLIYGILLAISIIAYNFIWLNKSFTMSEGWSKFYIELMGEGKIPYRDFYYFLPPLNLLIDYIIWKFSFGYFFVFRLWRLAERVLIAELMYKLLNRRLPPAVSAIGCFTATVLASANVYDLIGDYNQTQQLLVVLLCLCVLKYIESIEERSKQCWTMLAGIVGGCMFLTKQTITVSGGITFACFFLFLMVIGKEKHFIKRVFSIVVGAGIPLSICFVYLLCTGSFSNFVYQVFLDTGSKGTLFDIVIQSQYNLIMDRKPVVLGVVLLFVARLLGKIGKFKEHSTYIKFGCILAIGVLFGCAYGTTLWNTFFVSIPDWFLFILLLCLISIVLSNKEKLLGKLVYVACILICALILLSNINGVANTLYPNDVFSLMVEFVCCIYIFLSIWMLYKVLNSIIKKTEINLDEVILACGAIASGWATGMSTGAASVSSITAFISFPSLLYIFSGHLNNHSSKEEGKVFPVKKLEIISVLIFVVCLSQKLVCSYSWWGHSEATFWEKTETSEISELKGFKFSTTEKKKYDELTKVIKENTKEDSIIYNFPYSVVYNIFLDNYNLFNFVPVVFYDVCADDFAIQEAEKLAQEKPDIVVWMDIPGCMEVHEEIFRGGVV